MILMLIFWLVAIAAAYYVSKIFIKSEDVRRIALTAYALCLVSNLVMAVFPVVRMSASMLSAYSIFWQLFSMVNIAVIAVSLARILHGRSKWRLI